MKSLLLLLIFGLFMGWGCNPVSNQQPTDYQPNVILILTDDQGIGDVGFKGNPFIQTPHLDQLASESIDLENFYVSPVCSPTRSSLMTGRYYMRTGIYDTYNGGSIMTPREKTMAEYFHEAGYVSGIFGKWHLGDHYPSRPMDQGFDEALIHQAGGVGQVGDLGNYFSFDSSYFDPVLYKNGEPVQTKGYCSDVYTDGALEFIDTHKDQPFFLYLSFNAPHTPLQLPEKYYHIYENLGEQFKASDDPNFLGEELSERQIEAAKRVYGMVTNIDDNVGRILEKLKKQGLEENTLVIFLTDNGPQQVRYKMGLRAWKTSVYEAGIKVPALFRYPKWEPKKVKETLAHIDMLPTIMEFCGIQSSWENPIDGTSFLSLLTGGEGPSTINDRTLFFHWQRGFSESNQNTAVRKGDFKLVANAWGNPEKNSIQLFNLADDPGESNDLATSSPEKVSELMEEWDRWLPEVLESSPYPDDPPRITIGTDYQTITHFNRNDAKGMTGIWNQEKVFGYWDVNVAKSGEYRFEVSFLKPIESGSRVYIKMAPFQQSITVTDAETKKLIFEGMNIKEGNYRLESWYVNSRREYLFPFSVLVKRRD